MDRIFYNHLQVEKQKILHGSLSKSTNLHLEESHAFAKNIAGTRLPSKSSYTNGSAEQKPKQKSPASEKAELSKAVDGVKSVQRTKKPSGDLFSFFNRYNFLLTIIHLLFIIFPVPLCK